MKPEHFEDLAKITLPHYLKCAAWSSSGTDNDGEELESLEAFEFSQEANAKALLDITYFISISNIYFNGEVTVAQLGHDLWLTRCGHRTGFWDRGYKYGDVLTKKSEQLGPLGIFINDNNQLDFS